MGNGPSGIRGRLADRHTHSTREKRKIPWGSQWHWLRPPPELYGCIDEALEFTRTAAKRFEAQVPSLAWKLSAGGQLHGETGGQSRRECLISHKDTRTPTTGQVPGDGDT